MATNIFKTIGLGIGYFFFFPFIIVAIALYAVFGIIVFIFQFIKLIILFFTGRTLFSDLPEDTLLKAKLQPETAEAAKEEQTQAPQAQPEQPRQQESLSNNPMYGSGYVSPIVFSDAAQESQPNRNVEPEPQRVPEIHVEPQPQSEPAKEYEPRIQAEPEENTGRIFIKLDDDQGGRDE